MKPLPDPDLHFSGLARQRLRLGVVMVCWVMVAALLAALVAVVATAISAPVAHAASGPTAVAAAVVHAEEDSSSKLQWAVTGVALANLLLSVSTWHAARQKAAISRLEQLEAEMRLRLAATSQELARLVAQTEAQAARAIGHHHLDEVYRELRTVATKVDVMVGTSEQTTTLMRQLLERQLR
jgi:hypothetical protein